MILELVVILTFGLVLGSFLNVVVHRLPRGEAVGTARSRCPGCGAQIPWYLNVPVLSWIALRGRCASCRFQIPLRYPLVEIAGAGVVGFTYLRFAPLDLIEVSICLGIGLVGLALLQLERRWLPPHRLLAGTWFEVHHIAGGATAGLLVVGASRLMPIPPFLILAPLALALVALFVIDFEHQLLPDALTIPGLIFGLFVSPWNPRIVRLHGDSAGWLDAVLVSAGGALLGFALLWGLATGYERIRGVMGLGGGDVKLAATIGAFTGPEGVIVVLLLASLTGVAFGLTLMALRRAGMQTAIPFGCFLAPAAFFVIVVGADGLWLTYQQLLQDLAFRLFGG